MAKGIIAGTGTVTFFDPSTNEIMCTSKTLIDSGISMAISAEEARGGSGNMLLGKYFHDSSFSLNLTDQIWDLQYIAMNCGGAITTDADIFTIEQVAIGGDSKIAVSKMPQEFGGELIGWYKKASESDDKFVKFEFAQGTKKSKNVISGATTGENYCVKYIYNSATARSFVVSADFIPSVVHAVLTINLFKAGLTQETLTSSSKIGEIIVDVPNMQLEGTQDLSLNASGIASVALSGSALATFDGIATCDGRGYYAIITEVIYDKDEWEDVVALVVANSNLEMTGSDTETLKVYKMFNNGTQPSLVDNEKLTFASVSSKCQISTKGVVSSVTGDDTIKITVTDGSDLSATATVKKL